jgi:hypothetical protein
MRKIRSSYRQGVVNTEEHPVLKKGQIIEILDENEEFFRVRVFLTGKIESIKKIHISLE